MWIYYQKQGLNFFLKFLKFCSELMNIISHLVVIESHIVSYNCQFREALY